MGEPQCTNDHDNVVHPIFSKGIAYTNYKEACHALAMNHCVLMDDLFWNCLKKGNIDAAVANNCDEEIGLEDVDDQLYEEIGLEDVDNQLYFESASDINNVHSPLNKLTN